jgi:hypothetical protein
MYLSPWNAYFGAVVGDEMAIRLSVRDKNQQRDADQNNIERFQ